MATTIRFGQVLVGQDFKLPGNPATFRRTVGRFAARVAHIGGHVNGHGSTGVPLDLDLQVEPVPAAA